MFVELEDGLFELEEVYKKSGVPDAPETYWEESFNIREYSLVIKVKKHDPIVIWCDSFVIRGAESDGQKHKEYQEMLDNLYLNLKQELNKNNIFDLKGFKNKYLYSANFICKKV